MSDKINISMMTDKGEIRMNLDAGNAPDTVENFINYAERGFYDGTIFHRVIPGFVIQGGGHEPDMNRKETEAPIKNEAGNGLKNLRGTIAMARTGEIHSATSQFFINLSNNDFLDHKDDSQSGFGYCVFGEVESGLDIVDAIASVETGSAGAYKDVPLEPVRIISVKRI